MYVCIDGYCPAEYFAYIPFYGVMMVAYIILAVGWAVACAIYR